MLSYRVSFFLGVGLLLIQLGIPPTWKSFLEITVGFLLVIISGLSIKKEMISRFLHRKESRSETYVENKEKQNEETVSGSL